MTNTETDLKPCECGGTADYIEVSGGHRVQCPDCKIQGGWGDYGYQAREAWNTRATPDHGLDKAEALKTMPAPHEWREEWNLEKVDALVKWYQANFDTIKSALTPISTEKDGNAQPFQCPEGLTCSGDGWDCIGDGLCEKDGNADGVEDIDIVRRCLNQIESGSGSSCHNEHAALDRLQFKLATKTPPAAGWQIPEALRTLDWERDLDLLRAEVVNDVVATLRIDRLHQLIEALSAAPPVTAPIEKVDGLEEAVAEVDGAKVFADISLDTVIKLHKAARLQLQRQGD